MKFVLIFLTVFAFSFNSDAQINKASLQASGLTCSMCSKAVLNALQRLTFVDKVDVNLESQEYSLSFKPSSKFELDQLSKAVEDAGFSVAVLKVNANVENVAVAKDQHIRVAGHTFHFLNGEGQQISGPVDITLVDKNFTSAKNHKKFSSRSKMSCVATGVMNDCCEKNSVESNRIYHVIL